MMVHRNAIAPGMPSRSRSSPCASAKSASPACRSLRAIRLPVGGLTVFVGANGVGKTNLYRSLQLLQAAAAGTLARELASEGGMESTLWAGKRIVNKPALMTLSVGLGAEDRADRAQGEFTYGVEVGVLYSYEVDIGVRVLTAAA
jgi:predicted ATPase